MYNLDVIHRRDKRKTEEHNSTTTINDEITAQNKTYPAFPIKELLE